MKEIIKQKPDLLDCTYCHCFLEGEELEYPHYEPGTKNPVCDFCYNEHFKKIMGEK